MKRAFLFLFCTGLLVSGCAIEIGNRTPDRPTLGQQLTDLKKARDTGAISDSEYDAQKARLLGAK